MSRLHAIAVAGAGVFGVAAVVSFLAFLTVNWAGSARRLVIAAVMFSIVAFLASTAIAVFGAARDTYARRGPN